MYKYKRRIGEWIFDIGLIVFFVLISFTFLFPLLNMLALSFSEVTKLGHQSVGILPKGFSLESYKYLLSDPMIYRYYFNTILYAATGTTFKLFITGLTAYPLSYNGYMFKKTITVLLTITMFFSGGMIPGYLLIRDLKMINTIWVYILPVAMSAYNVIVFRTFFQGIPESLKESALIDGASHFRIYLSIILPLSKPLLATIGLFTIVGYWNDFMTAVLYLDDPDKYPIQIMLRRLLIFDDYKTLQRLRESGVTIQTDLNARTTRSAVTILTILPILTVYPFLQKYFAKGVLVGSVKG